MALYDAFVSYSHAKDKPIAAALQRAVQTLGKPWYRRRALRVFRDDTSLSATPHLWPTIEQALGQSRFLLLLASPEAATSQWVNKEVAYWLEHKSADTLLIAVTDGALTWDNAINDFALHENTPLPPVLKGRFASEPKWVDLTAYRDGADKRDAKFTELAADFAAAIRGMPKEDLLSQEVKQQRRALRLAWSAASMLLILAVAATTAGVLAYRAQQEAIAQRDRAEQTLTAATRTANGLVFDLAQRFRDAVGVPAALVKDILDRAVALQQQLTASGQVTPELQRSQASALMETATALLTVGDTAGALTAAERARQILETLLAADPGNTDWRNNLFVSYDKIGDALLATGRRDEALAAYRKSLAIARQLADGDAGNAQRQHDLALSYERIGNVLVVAGQREEALAAYQTSLAIRRQLADSDKSNAQWQRDLFVGYIKLGDVLLAAGQREAALAAYQTSLATVQQLADSNKSNAQWQLDLSVNYERIGDVLMAAGRREEALAAYQKRLAIVQQLTDSDKGNAQWQRDLSVTFRRIGDVLTAAGQREEALAAYQKGLAIAQRLADSDKGNAQWQRDLPQSYDRIGDILLAADQREPALDAYRKGLAIRQRLADSDRGNAEWQHDLAISYGRIGDAQLRAGRREEALAAYRQVLALIGPLADSDGGNAPWQSDLSTGYGKIGDVLRAAGEHAEALAAYQKSLDIRLRLFNSDKGNAQWQRDLTVGYVRIGQVLTAAGRLDAALEAYRNSLAVAIQLAAVDRGNSQWQNDLQFVIDQIASTAYRFTMAREFAKALQTVDQAIALAPGKMWLHINRAHALMFLDRRDEARTLYLAHRGLRNVQGEKSWDAATLEDFAEMRKTGLTHPMMDEIEKQLAAGG